MIELFIFLLRKNKWLIPAAFFLFPAFAFAASQNLGCADVISTTGTASCTGDVFTLGSGVAYVDISGFSFDPTYMSYVVLTGSLPVQILQQGACAVFTGAGTQADRALSGCTTPYTVLSFYRDTDPSRDFQGTIGSVCISDTLYECVPPPEATSTVATTTVISNPNQDLVNGFYLFFMGFFGIIWLFAKRR